MHRIDHFFSTLLFSTIFYYYTFDYFFNISGIYLKYLYFIVLVFLTAYFSFLPDIDIRYIKKVSSLCRKRNILSIISCFILKPTTTVFKHRTITHSLLILPPISYLLYNFSLLFEKSFLFVFVKIFSLSVFFAILFHIIEDMFTTKGVPLFYPLSRKNFNIAKFNSNSLIGNIFIRIIYISIFLLWLYLEFYSDNFFFLKLKLIELFS